MASTKIVCKRFSSPDEVRPFAGHGKMEVVRLAGAVAGKGTFEPGWRWSKDVKPIAKTDSCQAHHLIYMMGGSMHVRTDEGQELELSAGDVVEILPGHDAWVTGNERCVALDFLGVADYAQAHLEPPKAETLQAPPAIH